LKNSITRKEADKLLSNFVKARNKYFRSKKSRGQAEYKRLQSLCAVKFDFLVEHRTKRYRNFANYEDLKQEGRLALLLALASYKPKRGNFFYWANQYIKTKISREANRHSTIRIPIKHARKMMPYKVSQMPIVIDSAISALNSAEDSQIRSRIEDALEMLPKEQRRIVQIYYELDGNRASGSITKVCKELKISRINCIKLLTDAKDNLRTALVSLDC
jgi:RNA polymerase sigma factor (sigma-70 family)